MFTRIRTFTCPQVTTSTVPPVITTTLGDPYWDRVVLLMHMEGAIGNTTFTEEKGQTVASYNATYNNTIKKFGATSVYSGINTRLVATLAKTVQFNLDFTIEGHAYLVALTGNPYFFDLGSNSFGLSISSGQWRIIYNTANIWLTYQLPQLNTWFHWVVQRRNGNLEFYVDGVCLYTAVLTGTISSNTVTLCNYGGSNYGLNGYLDEVRITKDIARYSGNFVPPTSVFPQALELTADYFWEQTVFSLGVNAIGAAVTDLKTGKALTVTSPATTTTTSKFTDELAIDTGTTGRLTIDDASYSLGLGDFTVEFWCKARSNVHNAVFQLSDTPGGLQSASYTQTLAFSFNGGMRVFGANADATSTTPIAAMIGNWCHCALVRHNAVLKLYVNGNLDTGWATNGQCADTVNYTGRYLIIGGYYGAGYWWNGLVQGFRITKAARYLSNFSPKLATTYPVQAATALNAVAVNQLDYDPYWYSNTIMSLPLAQDTLEYKGATVVLNATQLKNTSAKFGTSSLYCPGTSYCQVTSTVTDGFKLGVLDFTIECWANPEQKVTNYPVILINNLGWGSTVWQICAGHDYAPTKFNFWCNNGADYIINSTTDIQYGVWTHLAVTRRSGTIRLFVNGVMEGVPITFNSSLSASNYIAVGSQGPVVTHYKGYVQDVRITKGLARYTESFTVPTKLLPQYGASF